LLHGVRLGVNCSLCCLGLMAVLLVGGMMNIALVAGLTVAIAAERLGPRPDLVARAIGGAIMATGAVLLARTL
jgi:predicted metal-binding membrane protein